MVKQTIRLIDKFFLLKIFGATFLALALFVLSIFQIIIPRFEEIIIDKKREMIRELTNSTWHIAEEFHKEALAGRMTISDAQKWAIEQVRNLRYGDELKDYFWITDTIPRMIVHPYRPDLNGKDLSNFTDSHGKKLFVEMVKVVSDKGEGYVDYMWQWKDDSTRIVPKLSYVKLFEPWGWIIGTGIYIEDVKIEIARLEQKVINISIVITIAISILLMFIAIQNLKSERKRLQAENELKESREKYKALVEASTEGLLMILEGKQIFYNKTLLSMLGYSEAEASSINLFNLFENIIDISIEDFENPDTLREKLNSHLETKLKKQDGSLIDVLITISPISFYGKNGVVLIVKDIGHHKMMAEALDENQLKYFTLTNQLSIAVFRLEASKEMKFIEANPEALNIFGFNSENEIYGVTFDSIFEDHHAFRMIYKDLLETGFVKKRIVNLKRKGSSVIVVSLSIVSIKDETGKIRYYFGTAEDITEEKQIAHEAESLLSEIETPILFLNQSIKGFIKELISCSLDEPIKNVASLMAKTKCEIVLIKNEAGKYIGMITKDDLIEFAKDRSKEKQPAINIMRSPLLSLNQSSTVYDVLALYNEKGIKYFPVKNEDGVIFGTINLEDILKSELNAYSFFLQQLKNAESVAEVKYCHNRLHLFIRLLIESGANVRNITNTMTLISDSIVRKLLSLTINELGQPPAKFIFLSLGSEGRKELTLLTDQDNAIVFENVSEDRYQEVQEYFLKLGKRVCTALDEIGFSFCKGNVMAMNPKWCKPLSVWKQYFTNWVTTANPQDLLDVSIFFDFRGVFGEESLEEELRTHLFNLISGNNSFFVYLTQNALKAKPPISQIKSGEFLDIKQSLLPIIDLIRIYSLKNKIKDTNTIERLKKLNEKNIFSTTGYKDILNIYNFLMQIRFGNQAKLISENVPPSNKVDIQSLSEIEKIILKKVLTQIEDFQTKLSLDIKGTIH